jgi:DNA-binding CsgD family transcriptional regulator
MALALGTLGFIDLTVGDVVAVVAGLERALRLLDAIGDRTQPAFRFQGDHAEALIGVGRLEEAETIIERLDARASLGPVPWAALVASRCRALLASARGELATAVEEAHAAVALARVSPMPMEAGRTYLAAGRTLRRAGHRRSALEVLEAADGEFARLGAAPWRDKVTADVARLGLHRTSGIELTPGELRVAQLAATGMTNREVAAKLFISPKTVEANLARAYSKLGIRSRAELGRVVADLESSSTTSAARA